MKLSHDKQVMLNGLAKKLFNHKDCLYENALTISTILIVLQAVSFVVQPSIVKFLLFLLSVLVTTITTVIIGSAVLSSKPLSESSHVKRLLLTLALLLLILASTILSMLFG